MLGKDERFIQFQAIQGGITMVMTPEHIEITTRADHMPGPEQGHWTYDHYATLPDDGQRYEIVDGVLYMAPAPNRWHQNAVLEIAAYLRTYVKLPHHGEVYIAPFDVQLSTRTIVQPDIMVILNKNFDKIKDARIVGAPDLVVEVASPGTVTHDRREKYDAYEQAGVSEYWMVDPATQTVEVRILEGQRYELLGLFSAKQQMRSRLIPEIEAITVSQFFLTA